MSLGLIAVDADADDDETEMLYSFFLMAQGSSRYFYATAQLWQGAFSELRDKISKGRLA